ESWRWNLRLNHTPLIGHVGHGSEERAGAPVAKIARRELRRAQAICKLLDDFVKQRALFWRGRGNVEGVLHHLTRFFPIRVPVGVDCAEAFTGLDAVAHLVLQNDTD